MNNRGIVLAIVIAGALIFVISGLRYDPGSVEQFSPAICGQLSNGGNAGPCPSRATIPGPRPERWDWAPFWVATD